MACLPVGYSLSVMVVCNAGTSSHLISLVPIKINQNLTYKQKSLLHPSSTMYYSFITLKYPPMLQKCSKCAYIKYSLTGSN